MALHIFKEIIIEIFCFAVGVQLAFNGRTNFFYIVNLFTHLRVFEVQTMVYSHMTESLVLSRHLYPAHIHNHQHLIQNTYSFYFSRISYPHVNVHLQYFPSDFLVLTKIWSNLFLSNPSNDPNIYNIKKIKREYNYK